MTLRELLRVPVDPLVGLVLALRLVVFGVILASPAFD